MTTQRLSVQNLLFVGFTLFSMFFGAGNLIFPPFLASQAGTLTWPAMAGFFASAVGLPVLGVAAVALSGGLTGLAGRAGAGFASFFTLLIYLAIGPCLAIPRTAGTSFEMTVLPALKGLGISLGASGGDALLSMLLRLGYSALFFGVAAAVALKPEKLTDSLGKVLCPTLLVLIAVIFAGCLVWPLGPYQPPTGAYAGAGGMEAAAVGFLEGYQTMDTIAALNFGIVIALNIQARGVKLESCVVRETIKAGGIAGLLLGLVYACLAHIGAPAGAAAQAGSNGAKLLTFVAGNLFGSAGTAILGCIFLIACLNTCIGLLSCCSEYFSMQFPRLSYRAWLAVFALASMVISCAGLDLILRVSVPVLEVIYPVAIVLIFLAFLERWIRGKRSVYRGALLLAGLVSLIYGVEKAAGGAALLAWLPGYGRGLGWILPAALGGLAGMVWPEPHRDSEGTERS